MTERRRGDRRRTRARVVLDVGRQVVEGIMLDVGETGAWVALPAPVEAGKRILLTFEQPGTSLKINAAAVVARSVPLNMPDVPPFGHGVEFDAALTTLFRQRETRSAVDMVPLMLRGADGVAARGVLVNVSGSGMLIVGTTLRKEREDLAVLLAPDGGGGCPRVQLQATVRWVRPRDASGFIAAGLAVSGFPTRPDRVTFANWVGSRMSPRKP